ncbi:hypothetical protein SCHPADRAFT_720592 [Schizopora paradoxa]|uniref:F-box domain-containing protein n=1 Tax=Schizopora paradoxa TaxID=27342 RepID=A0A0H2R2J6_9AGAM|nr:hypothetical protein SCHPADRAFT_720592 [Schizopora paradoxa]
MYSCRLWNNALSGPFFSDVGLLYSPEPGVLCTRTSVEIQDLDAYFALVHWRLSTLFTNIDTVNFMLASDDSIRNEQLSCMSLFFASLPINRRHFRAVHIFLKDYETGVDLHALADAITSLHRTGCAELWIHSSFLSEPGRSDTFEGGEIDPVSAHNMLRLCIRSPTLFSKSLLPWLVSTLESGTSLTSVDVLSPGLGPSQWAAILPRVRLHYLRDLRLVGVDLPVLLDFLGKHPSLRAIRLDGLQISPGLSTRSHRLILPRLNHVEGDAAQIAHFLELSDPVGIPCFSSVVFREDKSLEVPSNTFDSVACLSVLRFLTGFSGRSYLSLTFNFVYPHYMPDPSFFDVENDSIKESRPERSLSLDRLNVNIYSDSLGDGAELLENCIGWTSIFSRIKVLRICAGEMRLTDVARQGYLQRLSHSLPETTISLVQ